jgi:hypothetical protein
MKIKYIGLLSVALFSFNIGAFAQIDLTINFSQADVLTFGGIDGSSFSGTLANSPAYGPGFTYLLSGTLSSWPTGGPGVLFQELWPGTSDYFVLTGGPVASGQITFSTTPPISNGAIQTSMEPGADGTIYDYTVQINDEHLSAVPDSSTYLADALLALPFAIQGLRSFRRRRTA